MSLVEVLVGVAIFVAIGFALMDALSQGNRAGAHAGETSLGVVVAFRTMDRVLSRGYVNLKDSVDASPLTSETVADGLRFSSATSVTRPRPGLLRLEHAVTWQSVGPKGAVGRGPVLVVRYLADPLLAMEMR